jgi:hypothetical protein
VAGSNRYTVRDPPARKICPPRLSAAVPWTGAGRWPTTAAVPRPGSIRWMTPVAPAAVWPPNTQIRPPAATVPAYRTGTGSRAATRKCCPSVVASTSGFRVDPS